MNHYVPKGVVVIQDNCCLHSFALVKQNHIVEMPTTLGHKNGADDTNEEVSNDEIEINLMQRMWVCCRK